MSDRRISEVMINRRGRPRIGIGIMAGVGGVGKVKAKGKEKRCVGPEGGVSSYIRSMGFPSSLFPSGS